MSRYVVGLRGGIGTGKSAVSDLFAAKGIVIADADLSARLVVEPGTPAYTSICDRFGPQVILPDGKLDRAALREIVFSDTQARQFLEQQTHSAIVQHLIETIKSAQSEYAILVLSTGLGKWPMMNRLLVVDAAKEVQVSRVMQRDDNTQEQVMAIIDTQPPRETRVAEADDIIVNDGDISSLVTHVNQLHEQYLNYSTSANAAGEATDG